MKYLVLLGVLLLCVSAQQNEIDVVLKLLSDLKNNAQAELDQLTTDYEQTKQQKEDLINQLQRSTSSQRAECNQRDQDWANKERDIKITLSFINWLEKRIKENNARLERLDINRCESNANFINDVKHSKKIMNMIRFLRNAIKSAKETDLPALLQSPKFIQLKSYLGEETGEEDITTEETQEPENAYEEIEEDDTEEAVVEEEPAEEATEEDDEPISPPLETLGGSEEDAPEEEVPENPLEAEEQLSEEQLKEQAEALNRIIARGKAAEADRLAKEQEAEAAPVDDGKYAEFSAAQQELLRFLDQLEGEVKGTLPKIQDNQVRSAMGYSDFKGLIHKENEAFKGHIVAENQNLEKLQNQLITILQATAACKNRLKQIQQTIDLAQEDLDGATAHFNEVKGKYEEEVNTFDDVYRIYKKEVGSQSTQYKQDVQAKINQ